MIPGNSIHLWQMYKSWKNGIPTHQFRKQATRDVNAMLDIDNTITEKNEQNSRIQQAMNEIKW